MPALGIILLIVQIAFAVHVVRTGRDTFWIYLILFVPALGCAVYFFTQVLPEMGASRTAQRTQNALLKAIDPQRELRKRKQLLEMSDTIDNRMKLGDECLEAGFFHDAIELYQGCLKGSHKEDPDILLKLADALFRDGQFMQAKQTLELLIAKNPSFRSHDGHLLYARSLEECGDDRRALEEYSVLADSYPGEEGRVRYALLLKKTGSADHAVNVFRDVLNRVKLAPRYYQKKEKRWVQLARQNLDGL